MLPIVAVRPHRTDRADALAHIPKQLLFPAPQQPDELVMGYDERGHCPMLVDDRCSIYDHRPQACRTYDCRVLAATGLVLDDSDKRAIAGAFRAGGSRTRPRRTCGPGRGAGSGRCPRGPRAVGDGSRCARPQAGAHGVSHGVAGQPSAAAINGNAVAPSIDSRTMSAWPACETSR